MHSVGFVYFRWQSLVWEQIEALKAHVEDLRVAHRRFWVESPLPDRRYGRHKHLDGNDLAYTVYGTDSPQGIQYFLEHGK